MCIYIIPSLGSNMNRPQNRPSLEYENLRQLIIDLEILVEDLMDQQREMGNFLVSEIRKVNK